MAIPFVNSLGMAERQRAEQLHKSAIIVNALDRLLHEIA